MPVSHSPAMLFRASGIIAMLLSIPPIVATVWSVRTEGIDATFPLLLLGIAVPLVPGMLAIIDRASALLPVAYGWMLSHTLMQLLWLPFGFDHLQKLGYHGSTGMPFSAYAYWITYNAVVGGGLACWLAGNYRLNARRKP